MESNREICQAKSKRVYNGKLVGVWLPPEKLATFEKAVEGAGGNVSAYLRKLLQEDFANKGLSGPAAAIKQ